MLWGQSGGIAHWDPLRVWKEWADDVHGGPIEAGHFLPEEAPQETADQLIGFLTSVAPA